MFFLRDPLVEGPAKTVFELVSVRDGKFPGAKGEEGSEGSGGRVGGFARSKRRQIRVGRAARDVPHGLDRESSQRGF